MIHNKTGVGAVIAHSDGLCKDAKGYKVNLVVTTSI